MMMVADINYWLGNKNSAKVAGVQDTKGNSPSQVEQEYIYQAHKGIEGTHNYRNGCERSSHLSMVNICVRP
jgi:hypothetical protein